jgi:hypothetical protein
MLNSAAIGPGLIPKWPADMRLILDCDLELAEAALALALKEQPKLTRIGWGWSYTIQEPRRARLFLRMTKTGMSITQTDRA